MRQARRESTVNAEDLPSNDGCYRKAIEGVDECLPYLDVASPLALIVKAVHTCDISALMIAP